MDNFQQPTPNNQHVRPKVEHRAMRGLLEAGSGKWAAAEAGQVLLIVTVLFSGVVLALTLGSLSPLVREMQIASDEQTSKQSYFTAEAGSEDAYYRYRNGQTITFPYTLSLATSTATISIATTDINEQQITSEGNANNLIRTVVKDLVVTDGFSFNYAIQTGLGGFRLDNNSAVIGNIYSNGAVTGGSSNPSQYNYVYGAIVSAGPSGVVSNIHATSTVYARMIHHATIDGDAYYQTFNGATSTVTVSGALHPNSSDQPTTTMPVSDALIATWETNAAAGGSVTCSGGSYTISSNTTLGPKKIPCNLVISGSPSITLAGTLWVTGNVTIQNSAQMHVADSVGNKSVAIIADNPGSNDSSGKFTLSNSTSYYGSTGNANSYVMLISMNTSAQNGGSTVAMDVQNGATGNVLVYAPHGKVRIQNNVALREVTAYQLQLQNNAVVIYQIGLAQPLFTSGPGGTWKISRWWER